MPILVLLWAAIGILLGVAIERVILGDWIDLALTVIAMIVVVGVADMYEFFAPRELR